MAESAPKSGIVMSFLNWVEKIGNKLPDPAMLFVIGLLLVWVFSFLLSGVSFSDIDPRNNLPLQIQNLLTGQALANFLSNMVTVFTTFAPLGIVLVAMLGVGVAEHSGYINTGLKLLLNITPKSLLTPMLILVAVVSHTATDAGYVLVIPLGAVIFYAAGRHPLVGIAAAFAGVSGGFAANFIPSGIDPLLQGFTQSAARIIDPTIEVNPLNNWFFTSASSLLIVLVGWFITEKIVEPRLKTVELDGELMGEQKMESVTPKELKAFWFATATMILGLVLLFLASAPDDSPMRSATGDLTAFSAPLMRAIVPLIFLLFFFPGLVYGFSAGTFTKSKDFVSAMSKSMHGMSYYIVMAFFCSLFIDSFGKSNIGAMMALKGASFLKELSLSPMITIVGIIAVSGFVNLFVGSASAKWALIGPILVPMLMQLGISPDLTQAAYRVGDSTTNIITPLMPYFPLVVVYAQRYVKSTGIGTLVSMMLPYTVIFFILWTAFLLIYWMLGIPLGLQSSYVYP